jgi:type VI secretion system Hcp family effector
MKAKPLKTIVNIGILTLTAVMLFSLMVGAGGVPSEAIAPAEGRQFAAMYILGPTVAGPYTHSVFGTGAIKVIDMNFEVEAPPNSGDFNDPWGIKPAFSTVTVTKEFDCASPDLNFYCATGQHFSSVVIHMLPVSTNPWYENHYYVITLGDAVINHVASRMVYREPNIPGGPTTFAHLEELSFKCGMITWHDINSGRSRSWDLVNNQVP